MADDRRRGTDERPPQERRKDADLPAGTPAFEGAEERGEAATAEDEQRLSGREASLWADAWRELRTNPMFLVSAALIVVYTIMAIWPGLFTSFYPGFDDPLNCNLSRSLNRPSGQHWFGFDLQGCDYYTRTVYGARVSMIIGVTVVFFAAAIAIIGGSLSGYYGGKVDTVIARITDMWFAIPTILGGIVIISALRNPTGSGVANFLATMFSAVDDFTNIRRLGVVMFVLIILGWPTMLRLMRSSVLETKEADYVSAARALGGNDLRIMRKHILPNAVQPVIVYGTILVGIVISAEAALSFLGIGLQLPAISWGLMISVAQTRILQAPHLLLFPGIFLSIAVFSFILMGDALRDALDPKLR